MQLPSDMDPGSSHLSALPSSAFGFCFSSLLPRSHKMAATASDIVSALHGFMQKRNKKQRKQGRVFLIATSVVLPVWRGPGGSFPSRAPSRSHDHLLLPKRLGRGLPALTLLISTHHLNSKLAVLLTKTDSYGVCISTSSNAKQPVRKKPGFKKIKILMRHIFCFLNNYLDCFC